MRARIAEHRMPAPDGTGELRLRVDLHGVGVYGPGDRRTLIRWEWITGLEVADGVTVRSAKTSLRLPAGAFGLAPDALAERLRRADSIHERPEVIGELLRT